MSKYAQIFNYLRQCPQLANLWSVAATEDIGVSVIIPFGASDKVQYDDQFDTLGNYTCDVIPFPSVFEDYQINCYRSYDSRDDSAPDVNLNVLTLDEVQSICDWIEEQNDAGNLPEITGKDVIAIECNPSVPQVRYVNPEESTIAYFITVRIRYVNTAKGKSIYAVQP